MRKLVTERNLAVTLFILAFVIFSLAQNYTRKNLRLPSAPDAGIKAVQEIKGIYKV